MPRAFGKRRGILGSGVLFGLLDMKETGLQKEIRAYFEDSVIPLISLRFADVAAAMSIRVEGSVGLGRNDGLSDMETMVFLPQDLWKAQGGQLQLALIHSLEPFSAHS